MRHASLFTGIGGFDLASTWMGWENIFQCEINEWCNTILEFYFPNTIRYANIKETDFSRWRGKIDILTGGFPCQPFSVAGQRKGQEDDRYLWPEMLRAIREIRPTWVVGENVGGILSMVQPGSESIVAFQKSLFSEIDKETLLEQEYVVETVCTDLEQEGYSVEPIVIPACAVGAPHRRDRVWFIAYCSDAGLENLQQGREDRVYGFETFAHTDGKRCNNRGNNWEERSVCNNEKRHTTEDQSKRTERECRAGEVCSIITDTECLGSDQICKNLQSKQSNGARAYSNGGERNAADSNCFDGNLSGFCSSETPQLETSRVQADTYSYNKRCAEQYFMSESEESGLCGGAYNATRCDWRNFPTQSPICRRDDGLSDRLDSVAVFKGQRKSKRSDAATTWRTESIKAFGNAIVPKDAFEIFNAIEKANALPGIK